MYMFKNITFNVLPALNINKNFDKYYYLFNNNKNKNISLVNQSIQLIVYYILSTSVKENRSNNTILLNNLINDMKNKVSLNSSTQYLTYLKIQSILDFWYFTKLLGYGDKFMPNTNFMNFLENKVMVIEYHLERQNLVELIYLYIFIRTLEYCDYSKYKKYLKYIAFIEKVLEKNTVIYGYYLTHVILYDCYFKKTEYVSKTSLDAFDKLKNFCKNRLEYTAKNIDLISEIVLCCKLCGKYDFMFLSKLINCIIENDKFNNYNNYHLNAVLVCASGNYLNE